MIPQKHWLYGMLIATVLATAQVYAAELTSDAQQEIEALLSRLGKSDCKFQRNGKWHDAAEAQAHLRRKLDYLVERELVASTEQFIERAASKSSRSGKAYQVQCGKRAPMASGPWLRVQLRALRAHAKR